MQNSDINEEQLLIFFNIRNLLNVESKKKKIKTTIENRIKILNLFESYLMDNILNKKEKNYSNDKFTKAIQKSINKRLLYNFNLEKQLYLYNKIINDIKNKFCQILGVNNIILLDNSFSIEDLLIPYLYKMNGKIEFRTNDRELFTKVPKIIDNNIINIINTNKSFEYNLNDIYYITNLKKKDLSFIKELNFIIDVKKNKHNINCFRIVHLKNYNIKDSVFNIKDLCKLWSTISYLGVNSLID